MSDEQLNKVKETEDNEKCVKAFPIIISVIALIFSIIALVMSTVTFGTEGEQPGAAPHEEHIKGTISENYDKGQTYEKALTKNKPVIVWFYVDWCGFCQKFAPTFEKITKNGKIKDLFAVAFVNCDSPENKAMADEYGVQAFPTVYVVNPKTGAKEQLKNEIMFIPDAKEAVIDELIGIYDKITQ